MLERLISALLPRAAQAARLSVALPDLEQQLKDRNALVDTIVADHDDPHDIIQALLAETRATQPGMASGSRDADASNAGEQPRIKDVAINAATRAPEFVELERQLRGLNMSEAQHQLDALDLHGLQQLVDYRHALSGVQLSRSARAQRGLY
eukprot:1149311-Pleurochrysis_carterae.AAC.1